MKFKTQKTSREKLKELFDLPCNQLGVELSQSPQVKPYVDFHIACLNQRGVDEAVSRISEIPLKDRLLWRIGSALQWAFADFDSVSCRVDWATMSDSDRAQIMSMIRNRSWQLSQLESVLANSAKAACLEGPR